MVRVQKPTELRLSPPTPSKKALSPPSPLTPAHGPPADRSEAPAPPPDRSLDATVVQQRDVSGPPYNLVAVASAVELRGPYPVSAETGVPPPIDRESGDSACHSPQQQAQLAAAVFSILPFALDGQVLAEGSVVCVAGLFVLVVTGAWAADDPLGGRAAKMGEQAAGRSSPKAGAGRVVVRVQGSTELRLSPPTRLRRGRSPPSPLARAHAPLADRSEDSAPSAYLSLDAREWTRLVEQDFGGLGGQVATAVATVGEALRGRGGSRHSNGVGGIQLTVPASGLLLHGPTGAGKTLLARSVAEHSGAPFFFLDCASVFRRDRGEAEQFVQDFLVNAGASSPSVVVLDQIESVCRRRPEAAGITELQVLSVILETMDRFRRSPTLSRVCFLATCPDAADLDPSLLQRGRLEVVLRLGALDSTARASILAIHSEGMVLELPPPLRPPSPSALPSPQTRGEFLGLVATRCHGYLGSDLERLCREAAMNHMSRTVTVRADRGANKSAAAATAAADAADADIEANGSHDGGRQAGVGIEVIGLLEAGDNRERRVRGGGEFGDVEGITLQDFWTALHIIRPASLVGHAVGMWGGDLEQQHYRGPAATAAAVAAAAPALVGCDAAMAELRAFIITPLANPSLLRDLGLRGATGALLHGPPGCGKTSVARALAAEVKGVANFLEVRCSDLVDKVIGRSERNVSDLFAAARAAAPCVLFLDQVEGLAARRGYHSSTEQTFDRILSTLLVEMDGVMSESGGHVVILAATNDIERLDPALLRPGRLDRRVFLGIPDRTARRAIFLQRLLDMPLRIERESVGAAREGGRGGRGEGQAESSAWGLDTANASAAKPEAEIEGSTLSVVKQPTGEGVGSGKGKVAPEVPPQQGPTPRQVQPPRPHRRAVLDSAEAYAEWLAGETEGSSGAHVTGLCREAALAALREGIGAEEVAPRHFEAVLGHQRGSTPDVVDGGGGGGGGGR